MSKSPFHFVAIGLAALGFLTGTALFRTESAVLTYGGAENAVLQDGIFDGSVSLGYSAYADQRLLSACLAGMTGVRRLANTAEDNLRFAGHCRSIADAAIERVPLSSFAWCVRAQTSALLGDFAAMNSELRKSRELGKYEGWIALNRNLIAEENFASLDADARTGNDADLAIMATSQTGIAAISRLYRADPEFRERMSKIASGLPADAQDRFVYELKRGLGAG
ncbi:hypothetical protein ABID16_002742 [Rhizobium aquaticum]|uniref:Uncharacterized protein n=1 Tax=Rhizobium aquaticum TaxID=1549636 RepID=A0ABV2J365_9HYPH